MTYEPGDLFPINAGKRWGMLLAYDENEHGWVWKQVAPTRDTFPRPALASAHALPVNECQDLLLAMPLHGDAGHVLTLTEQQAQHIESMLVVYVDVLRCYDAVWREGQHRIDRSRAASRLGHADSRKRPRKTHDQIRLEGQDEASRRAANAALGSVARYVASLVVEARRPLEREVEWGAYAALADNVRFQRAAECSEVPAGLEADNVFGVIAALGPEDRQKRRRERQRRFADEVSRAKQWGEKQKRSAVTLDG